MQAGRGLLWVVLLGWILFTHATQAQSRKAQLIPQLSSESDELMPVLSADGATLYFVRTGHPKNMGGIDGGQDIWFSTRKKGSQTWEEPKNIGTPLNNILNNGVIGTDAAGTKLWLSNIYSGKNKMAPGLSYANKTDKGWSRPQPVTIQNFTPQVGFVNFCLASDSVLLISMQLDTTQLEDIFMSRLIGEKLWSEPVSLGKNINTAGFEIAPYLAPDNRTLYFTSNGHQGYGDADIFRSRRLDANWRNWSEPENLGPAVNTAGFEGYFRLDAGGGEAYFAGDGGQKEDLDIYLIRLADITHDENKGTVQNSSVSTPLAVPAIPDTSKTKQPVFIQFESGSAEISSVAKKNLDEFLIDFKTGTITISGHADDTGDDARNLKLSEIRAREVANYLVKGGVAKKRVQVKVFSNLQPLAPNTSEQNRARNRRVQVEIRP